MLGHLKPLQGDAWSVFVKKCRGLSFSAWHELSFPGGE